MISTHFLFVETKAWCCGKYESEIEMLLKQQSSPKDTAAILVEPVQGEGGYIPAPKGHSSQFLHFCFCRTQEKMLVKNVCFKLQIFWPHFVVFVTNTGCCSFSMKFKRDLVVLENSSLWSITMSFQTFSSLPRVCL